MEINPDITYSMCLYYSLEVQLNLILKVFTLKI